MICMAACMCLAGMPGIMLGFFYAINLKPEYPASTPAFGAILDFMMRDGGASEFCGVMAACGALAAIMSTIDSATLAATNIITKEGIVNGLAKLNPQLVEPTIMSMIERACSGMILGIAMFFVCHHIPIIVENDPLEATLMMNRIGFYQFGFITQAFPPTMSALFFPKDASLTSSLRSLLVSDRASYSEPVPLGGEGVRHS
jgi:Na+/pantothenate symporter